MASFFKIAINPFYVRKTLKLVRYSHLNPLRARLAEEMKGDERILGDGEFVESVLKAAQKNI